MIYPKSRPPSQSPRDPKPYCLPNQLLPAIINYLRNPTSVGLWVLEFDWHDPIGVSAEIYSSLEDAKKNKNEELERYRRLYDDRRIQDGIARMSFLMFVLQLASAKVKGNESEISRVKDTDHTDSLLYDAINGDALMKKYAPAVEYFSNHILCDGFRSAVLSDKPFEVKDGFLLLVDSTRSGYRRFIALEPGPIERFHELLKKLGKATSSRVRPLFSPEEHVFTPYIRILEIAYKLLIDDDRINVLIERAISENSQEKYTHCVREIGLVAEDYLTQIYETLFREVCPRGQTLGQINESIHRKIKDQFSKPPKPEPDFSSIYQTAKNLSNIDWSTKSQPELASELIKLIREAVNLSKFSNEHLREQIRVVASEELGQSIYPKWLKENVHELIRARNAASHKSVVPIGRYDALRAVYCCVTLILWWQSELKEIDWKQDAKKIIEESMTRNNGEGR